MAPEKFPETKPRKMTDEDKRAAEQARIQRELAEDRVLAGLPPEVTIPLTETQITVAEAEKRQLAEDARLTKELAVKRAARQPIAQDGLEQKDGPRLPTIRITAVKPDAPKPVVDPAAVAERLATATELVQTKSGEIEAAAEQDRQNLIKREAELAEANRLLGLAQEEERRLVEQRTAQELRGRADIYQKEAARNRVTEATSAAEVRKQFTMQAGTLMTPALEFLAAVEAFLEEHRATLTNLSRTTWESAPAEWQPVHRVELAERAARPAGSLLSELSDAYVGGVELVRKVDEVIAGRGEPSPHLLERLRMVAGRTMQSFTSQLGVLNTSIRRVEEKAIKHVRPEVEMRVTPYSPPMKTTSIDIGYDVHK